jgi:hypothetical protein
MRQEGRPSRFWTALLYVVARRRPRVSGIGERPILRGRRAIEYRVNEREEAKRMSGVAGGFTSTGAILVLYILLVIVLSAGYFV